MIEAERRRAGPDLEHRGVQRRVVEIAICPVGEVVRRAFPAEVSAARVATGRTPEELIDVGAAGVGVRTEGRSVVVAGPELVVEAGRLRGESLIKSNRSREVVHVEDHRELLRRQGAGEAVGEDQQLESGDRRAQWVGAFGAVRDLEREGVEDEVVTGRPAVGRYAAE